MEAKERIKKAYEFLRSKGIVHTQQDVADIMGIKKENISRAFNGNDKYLTPSFITRFNNAFGNIFNADWIIKEEGEMIKEAETIKQNSFISAGDIQEGNYFGTLVYDIDGTCGPENRDIDFTKDNIIGSVNLPGINKSSYIIRANGDSMEPRIYDGNMVVIREIQNWEDIFYGQMYLILLDEYRMIKYIRRYEPDEENYIILRSENPQYDDIKLHKRKIRKMFIVENILSVKTQL